MPTIQFQLSIRSGRPTNIYTYHTSFTTHDQSKVGTFIAMISYICRGGKTFFQIQKQKVRGSILLVICHFGCVNIWPDREIRRNIYCRCKKRFECFGIEQLWKKKVCIQVHIDSSRKGGETSSRSQGQQANQGELRLLTNTVQKPREISDELTVHRPSSILPVSRSNPP